ncbi:hypothetical protein PanWU01x14_140650 [Parasponia andersonii]|uniref:Uncharacterized protein n=1 Tax=Parasponia andersonii TaxID=3476 RepID=A0A2P5CM10_PARAD|nr:hypothetical protein PanWU01x14_140650 [Parasponia andersonii]
MESFALHSLYSHSITLLHRSPRPTISKSQPSIPSRSLILTLRSLSAKPIVFSSLCKTHISRSKLLLRSHNARSCLPSRLRLRCRFRVRSPSF